MYSHYDIYAVVSQEERKIYFIDFSILKQIYRRFELKEIHHPAQTTIGYLVPIGNIRSHNGLLGEVAY